MDYDIGQFQEPDWVTRNINDCGFQPENDVLKLCASSHGSVSTVLLPFMLVSVTLYSWSHHISGVWTLRSVCSLSAV
jgi:hypothetical protein